MLIGTEPVQGMRRQLVLHQMPASPEVHDRDDRPVDVVLDGNCTGVPVVAIHEVRERHDALVANPVGPVEVDHPR